MASFEEIMKMPSTEIKAPQAYPTGTYHCIIPGPPTPGKSSKVGTPYLRFEFKILSPQKDVDAKQAAEQQVVGKIISNDYYITDQATYRCVEMLVDSCGIPQFADDGKTQPRAFEELVADAPNRQLLVNIRHDTSDDGKRTFHKVHSTAHV